MITFVFTVNDFLQLPAGKVLFTAKALCQLFCVKGNIILSAFNLIDKFTLPCS